MPAGARIACIALALGGACGCGSAEANGRGDGGSTGHAGFAGSAGAAGNPDPGEPQIIDFTSTIWDGWDYSTGCPTLEGPSMVPIPAPGGNTYCIDSTEVSVAHYERLTAEASGVLPAELLPPYCGLYGDDRLPTFYEPDDFPAQQISWCAAWAYCKWAGKRLCGRIGGGPAPMEREKRLESQWYVACSRAGERTWPYDAFYDPDLCVTEGQREPAPVGSTPTCEGGFPGLFDMSGNVSEWVDSCDGWSATERGDCILQNGGFDPQLMDPLAPFDPWPCHHASAGSRGGGPTNPIVGFRCCGP